MNWIGFALSFRDRFDDLIGQLSRAGIDDERALRADLHRDVGAISRQHVNVVRRRATYESRPSFGVGSGARLASGGPEGIIRAFAAVSAAPASLTLFASSGYIVSAPPSAASNGTFR